MSPLPKIGFDTSVINALEDDGEQSAPLMTALRCGFDVRLPAMTAEEILSTPTKKNARRELLLARCQQLLASGWCLWPPGWILHLLILQHFRNPSQFDWRKVDVRARPYERAIIDRDFTEHLCGEQRREQFEEEKASAQLWKSLRPKLDEVLAKEPSKRPLSYRDAVAIARMEGNVLWGFGGELYRDLTDRVLSETETKAFLDICPPFRAACYALIMLWYDGALRLRLADEKQPAGRNDLLMVTYLPYCGRFVTNDCAQEKSLREIAAEASIDCEVLSYQEFSASFTVAA